MQSLRLSLNNSGHLNHSTKGFHLNCYKKIGKIEKLEMKLWKLLILCQTLGHLDVQCRHVRFQMVCMHNVVVIKRDLMFNSFPWRKLPEIVENERSACFSHLSAVCYSQLLYPHPLTCTTSVCTHTALFRTRHRPARCGPVSADVGTVRHFINRNPWSPREHLHDQLVILMWWRSWHASEENGWSDGRESRSFFVLNNLVIKFLKGKLLNFTMQNRLLYLILRECKPFVT